MDLVSHVYLHDAILRMQALKVSKDNAHLDPFL